MKKGWQIKPLQELCNNFKQDIVDGPFGSELQRKDYLTKGIPVLKIQNIKPFTIELKKMDYVSPDKFQELKRHSYREGDIVMTKLGCPLGVSAIVENLNEGIIVADLVRIRAQCVNTKYLCYYLNSQQTNDFINSKQKGTTRPRVTLSVIRELPIAIPSMEEQQRIVMTLDKIFASIDITKTKIEKNLLNTKSLFENYLNTIFSVHSEGWVEKRLEQIGTTQTGSTPSTSKRENYGNFIPFIKPGDFYVDGSLDYTNDGLSEQGLLNAHRIKAGSTLMVCIGATIGKCGYSNRDITTNQQINAFTPFNGISYKFVYYQMLTKNFQRRVLLSSGKATLPIINKSKWSALTIALPPMLQEQENIVSKCETLFDETQRLESIYKSKLTALDELKKSLLQQAISGDLRVSL